MFDKKYIYNFKVRNNEGLQKNHNGNIGLVTVGAVGGLIPYMPYESKRRGRIRSYPMIIGIVENPATYILDGKSCISIIYRKFPVDLTKIWKVCSVELFGS